MFKWNIALDEYPMRAFLLALLGCIACVGQAQNLQSDFYTIGTPSVVDYYIDPANGDDGNAGTSRQSPRRTVTSVWNQIAQNTELSTGVRMHLLPGTYGSDHLPNYWENRIGTATAPIIVQAADGFGSVVLSRDINMANVHYFYLLGVEIRNRTSDGYGDAFHCERCQNILLRGNSFNGAPLGRNAGGDIAHETIKFNQSQHVYIENNNIQGADDNGVDFVSVQYGHLRANRIHDTQGWCAYVKGGSSYLTIESNLAYNCGEGGITAGQGTGFEFMEAPWTRFEANYIKIVNNIIHDIQGAALGVNGGYAVLIAHNTAYRVGARSHLLEIVFGERSCDGDTAACAARQAAGGWGPTATGTENVQPIGNNEIIVSNNVFYNPSGFVSGSQHFAIYGPRAASAPGLATPQRTDTGLRVLGNVIWNGPASMPIGVEEADQGCQPGNPTCTIAQLAADNRINQFEPEFTDAANEDFRPLLGGTLAATNSVAAVNFTAIDAALNPITEGDPNNSMVREFSGAAAAARPPGAIVSAQSSITFPSSNSELTTPGVGGATGEAPAITIAKASAVRVGRRVKVAIVARVSDADGIASVTGAVSAGGHTLTSFTPSLRSGRYVASLRVRSSTKRISIVITAVDVQGLSSTKTRAVRVK